MDDKDTFIVQSDTPDRLFVKVYHDFLDSELLDRNEKMVFILLKRYLNFKEDINGIKGQAYPTLDTLCKQCAMSKGAVIRSLKSLQKKKVLEIEQRGLNKPNLYTIKDYASVWKSGTQEEMSDELKQHEFEKIERLAKEYGYKLVKEKSLVDDTGQSNLQSSQNFISDTTDNTIEKQKSQVHKAFTRSMLNEIYDFEILKNDRQSDITLLDSLIELILEVLNSNVETERVNKSDMSIEIVKSRLLKLNYMHLEYAADELKKQTTTIKNKRAYMITTLFNSYTTMDMHYINLVKNNEK